MNVPSVLTLLSIGVGPSSSHTLGPLRAARDFRSLLLARGVREARVQVTLLGSLAYTGKGHLTDLAVTAGLAGYDPASVDGPSLHAVHQAVRAARGIRDGLVLQFDPDRDIAFDTGALDLPHPNTLRFRAAREDGTVLLEEEYRSIGGGAVSGGSFGDAATVRGASDLTMGGVLEACLERGIDLAQFVRESEEGAHGLSRDEIASRLASLWTAMTLAIERGLRTGGVLPGRLQLERRAPEMLERLEGDPRRWHVVSREITLAAVYALAVAEENAAGGRVVTAPTCGSAGVVPATLLMLQERFLLPEERMHDALLVAGLVGLVVAGNASISGAEAGCQAEVGTASAMAAAAACQLLGGSVLQVESAAEMALEHHLGLTCDPVCGLVQIPCIERNAVGAVTALNAASMALLGSGKHQISFDRAVATMKQVGLDMDKKYKETALGGLALRGCGASPTDPAPSGD